MSTNTTDILLALPILIPLLTAVLCLLAWRRPLLQRGFGVAGALALMAASVALFPAVSRVGILVTQAGNWPAPFGITLVADLFSAVMLVVTGVIGAAITVYSLAGMDPARVRFGYYPLLHILLLGVCGSFLTGDVFNLYVWFEVMLISSFVLLALGGERAQLEGAVKYVALNLMASALFLAGVGLLYGLTGTLNMADLARKVSQVRVEGLVNVVAMLFLLAFGIKAAMFPLFFWLPASYHTPPAAVTVLFSALLTKVGVYAMVRLFTLLFPGGIVFDALLGLGALTMVTGVLGAMAQTDVRRLLSFHIVSQIGYLLMGLGLGTRLGLAGVVFFMVHVILSKSALFLVSDIAGRMQGTYELARLGGLFRRAPLLAAFFLIPALSLGGIPPLSGFFAKLTLVVAGLEAGQGAVVAVALGVSLLTLYSMTKIWLEAFWKPEPEAEAGTGQETEARHCGDPDHPDKLPTSRRAMAALMVPTATLAVLSVVAGLLAQPLFRVSERAGHQLAQPDVYVRAVLGGER